MVFCSPVIWLMGKELRESGNLELLQTTSPLLWERSEKGDLLDHRNIIVNMEMPHSYYSNYAY